MSEKKIPWHKNDALFKKELESGLELQRYVAEKIEALGYETEVPDLQFRKSIRDAKKFKDIADIIVTHPDEERVRFVAEVKSRRLTFKTAKSYPWPTVFIDTVEGYHAKTTKPAIYVVVSRDSGACIAMPGELTDSWGVTETWDRVRQIKVTNYVSPKEDWTTLRRAVQGVHRNLSSARP